MMARREQSQFDDALEDAESDMLNPKTHPPSGPTPYIHRNGHLSSKRGMEDEQHDGTNGELPESDTAEEEVQEERTEDEWNGHHEDADETRMETKQPLSPEEDGQDEYGDTFFIDQGDTGGIQGYGSAYQYSEGDDGTREGTEDSGQGQIRDDLTESDKDKDYLDDVTQENRGIGYDQDDQYEDSGVVDDNGMMDGEGGMQGYEAEEDHAEGEDRFEEVDIRYGYMDGGYMERQSYPESRQYVEDNPAYNGSEQDYEADQEFREKDVPYQEYTESDLPDPMPASEDKSSDNSRVDMKYEREDENKEHVDHFSDSEKLRIGEHSQMTGDYVIVDRDTLAPEENLRYAASDSAEADQEEQLPVQQEDFEYRNTRSGAKKSELTSLDSLSDRLRKQSEETKLHQFRLDDRGTSRDAGRAEPTGQERMETGHERRIQGQTRRSPQQASSPVRDSKESRNKVPRRPAPGSAQSVQRNPVPMSSSKAVHQSPMDIAPVPQHKAPSPGSQQRVSERDDMGKGEFTSQRSSSRPMTKSPTPRGGVGVQESRMKAEGSRRLASSEKRSMPLPGGAQPVSVLKSRLREELREMYEIEKNLASTSIQPEMNRTHNSNPERSGGGMESPRDGSLSNRHNAEYAPVSSLSSSGPPKQTSPTHRMKYSQEPLPNRQMSRSPSSSPEKMRSARPGHREQPRNNSNANHLDLDPVVRRSRPNSRQHDPTKRYSYEIEEKSDATSGEVVFDDIAECGAYLDEKDAKPSPIKIKNRQGKSPSGDVDDFGARRRRNSYELANRSSSEDEENDAEMNQKTSNKEDLGLLGSQGGNLLGSGQRGPGMNSSLLSQLAERELANLRNSYKKPQEEPPERQQESQSVASDTSSTSSSTAHEGKPPLPKLSPMEYDAVGFRLAGHAGIGESTLNLSAAPPQQSHPEADQFSDADEDGSEPAYPQRPNTTITPSHSYEQDYSSPMYRKRPLDDYHQKTSPVSPQQYRQEPEAPPTEQVDVDAAMKELHSALNSSKSKLMKAPSFYTPEEVPVWIRQPEAARRHEEDQKKSRVLEDRRRRTEEMRRSHVQQRAEYMKRRDPQCYVRNEEEEEGEDEDKGLMSEPEPKMGAPDYTDRQRPVKEPETMRAPDLPPTTGKIREGSERGRDPTALWDMIKFVGPRISVDYDFKFTIDTRGPHDETALGRGIIYPAAYLGSTQLVTTKQPTKKVRMQQAQEAVNRIKTRLRKRWYKERPPPKVHKPKRNSPDGEEQPSTEVDLAISNERIRVLNADTQETMMDHPLKTISYIADIGNIVVIMARRRQITRTLDEAMEESGVMLDADGRRQPRKIICHVFETEDAQLIAQTIGQAFALAYLEFLKANGIEDPHAQEIDYHDVLNSQEIYGDDLMLFSNKECEKEVLVEKERGEIMGMVVVESGWGSLIPTVVIANMSPFGAAARSGKLNIGDQVMSINGTSLVGLPLQQCQQTIKGLKSQCLVKFNVVSCPPVTQVLIKRPDTKYQLGFSVQNGIICSLMRGGIAERGGVRVGHRIIEINGSSVVATAHEKIVEMLSTSVGEIRMKTMPLSMYKLLTGQEQPVYI